MKPNQFHVVISEQCRFRQIEIRLVPNETLALPYVINFTIEIIRGRLYSKTKVDGVYTIGYSGPTRMCLPHGPDLLNLSLTSTLVCFVFFSELLLRAFRIKEKMGRCSTKKVFLIQSPILFLHLLISFSSGAVKPDSRGVCVSKGGRFPPYESAGKPPNSVGRGSKDLTMCRVFRKRTCCSPAQTTPAFVAVRNLATYGEASQDCLHLFELLECSICNPDVGIQPGPPRICASFCDRVFDACKDAYFASNALTQTIGPCGVNDDIICVKASNWESNGTSFCEAAGFAVQTNEDSREEPCYGSKASLESVVESWSRDSKKKTSFKTETLSCFKDLLQWVRVMTTIQKVSLGVSFLVAGMFLIRQWNNHKQKQRLAAIQRAARRLGGDANGDSYSAALNRRLVQ